MKLLHPVLALLTILFLAIPALAGDRVIARVGDEPITQRELETAIRQNPDLNRQKILDFLIDRRLIIVWATENNISITDQEVEDSVTSIRQRNNMTLDQFKQTLMAEGETLGNFKANLREQLTINRALTTALSSKTEVSDSELKQLYSKTYKSINVFGVSHILISLGENATPEEVSSAREKAEEILSKIKDGVSFDSLVRQYSDDKATIEKGGYLGKFREGELIPQLEKLAATLEPGEVGGPVRTPSGFHILLLVSRDVTKPPPFAEVKYQLERQLKASKEESARTAWLKELRKTIYVEVFPDGG